MRLIIIFEKKFLNIETNTVRTHFFLVFKSVWTFVTSQNFGFYNFYLNFFYEKKCPILVFFIKTFQKRIQNAPFFWSRILKMT